MCADFTGLLFKDTWDELRNPTAGQDVPSLIWVGFCAAALTVSTLNYYWFGLMLRSVARVYLHGHTWTDISNNKHE
jgi:fluoride ion exporter CrcB/FEX